jgi:hypothetical protein
MSLIIKSNLTDDVNPVIKSSRSDVQVFNCAEFKGKYSSITGIYSKFMYIGKINELSGEVESPTVRIICGPECIDKCINLKLE